MNDNLKPGPEGVQVQIKVDEITSQGVYANMAMVHHTDGEFTLDFIYMQPQGPQATVRSRVITSPRHLKRLIGALQDNLAKYEAKFGAVEMAPPPPTGGYRH